METDDEKTVKGPRKRTTANRAAAAPTKHGQRRTVTILSGETVEAVDAAPVRSTPSLGLFGRYAANDPTAGEWPIGSSIPGLQVASSNGASQARSDAAEPAMISASVANGDAMALLARSQRDAEEHFRRALAEAEASAEERRVQSVARAMEEADLALTAAVATERARAEQALADAVQAALADAQSQADQARAQAVEEAIRRTEEAMKTAAEARLAAALNSVSRAAAEDRDAAVSAALRDANDAAAAARERAVAEAIEQAKRAAEGDRRAAVADATAAAEEHHRAELASAISRAEEQGRRALEDALAAAEQERVQALNDALAHADEAIAALQAEAAADKERAVAEALAAAAIEAEDTRLISVERAVTEFAEATEKARAERVEREESEFAAALAKVRSEIAALSLQDLEARMSLICRPGERQALQPLANANCRALIARLRRQTIENRSDEPENRSYQSPGPEDGSEAAVTTAEAQPDISVEEQHNYDRKLRAALINMCSTLKRRPGISMLTFSVEADGRVGCITPASRDDGETDSIVQSLSGAKLPKPPTAKAGQEDVYAALLHFD